MAGCYWMVGYILLELEKLASEAPELRYIVEKVLGQGTVPGSNWGQRLCELVLHMWDTVFEVLSTARTRRRSGLARSSGTATIPRAPSLSPGL